ncbi:hypothetical protein V5O48_017248 [Marasmius crinis-equi]|uniref:Glycoside hydrolase family 5 C-terminal domain-containing protein n=1 Tax=Marasmius crinis-equi TaxID=585013 RepID=A0ABR3EPH1_9AGAR
MKRSIRKGGFQAARTYDGHYDQRFGEVYCRFYVMEIQPHDNDSVGDQSSLALDKLLPVVVKPYPAKMAGIPLRREWEVTKGMFVFEWSEPEINAKAKASASVENPPSPYPA